MFTLTDFLPSIIFHLNPYDHSNKNLQVFAGLADNNGQSIRLVLPISNDLKDTHLRIYQAVQTIADIEDRSLNAVVADIQKVKASQ